jgi:hypothetical protein
MSLGGKVGILVQGLKQVVQSVFLALSAIFLVWGPLAMRSLSVNIYLLGLAALMSGKSKIAQTFVVFFSVLTFFCITGTGAIFGYPTSIFEISDANCAGFFNIATTDDRCDGYLQFLRVLSAVDIFVVAAVMLSALFAIDEEKK